MDGLIRRCRRADAAAIAAIYDPIVAATSISFEEEPPGAHEMACRIEAAADVFPWFGFERNGTLAGFAYASQHRTRAAYRWSVDVSVYVARASHRSGVGRRLYTALLGTLAEQGYRTAFAGIALPNDASTGFHRSMGFTEVGTYHRVGFKFGRWRDVLWLERALRTGDEPPREISAAPG